MRFFNTFSYACMFLPCLKFVCRIFAIAMPATSRRGSPRYVAGAPGCVAPARQAAARTQHQSGRRLAHLAVLCDSNRCGDLPRRLLQHNFAARGYRDARTSVRLQGVLSFSLPPVSTLPDGVRMFVILITSSLAAIPKIRFLRAV